MQAPDPDPRTELGRATKALRILDYAHVDAPSMARALVEQAATVVASVAGDGVLLGLRDVCDMVSVSLRDAVVRLAPPNRLSEEGLVEVVSHVESSLVQLRELAMAQLGHQTLLGPSGTLRATKARRAIAALRSVITLAGTQRERARRVGTALANVLGLTDGGILGIHDRYVLSTLRRRIHGLLVSGGADSELELALADVVSTVDLLAAQLNSELREHDLVVLTSAENSLLSGDLRTALFTLRSVEGHDGPLDRAIANGDEASLSNQLRSVLAELRPRPSLSDIRLVLDSVPPSP